MRFRLEFVDDTSLPALGLTPQSGIGGSSPHAAVPARFTSAEPITRRGENDEPTAAL
jgi:hypothetical protein